MCMCMFVCVCVCVRLLWLAVQWFNLLVIFCTHAHKPHLPPAEKICFKDHITSYSPPFSLPHFRRTCMHIHICTCTYVRTLIHISVRVDRRKWSVQSGYCLSHETLLNKRSSSRDPALRSVFWVDCERNEGKQWIVLDLNLSSLQV